MSSRYLNKVGWVGVNPYHGEDTPFEPITIKRMVRRKDPDLVWVKPGTRFAMIHSPNYVTFVTGQLFKFITWEA